MFLNLKCFQIKMVLDQNVFGTNLVFYTTFAMTQKNGYQTLTQIDFQCNTDNIDTGATGIMSAIYTDTNRELYVYTKALLYLW